MSEKKQKFSLFGLFYRNHSGKGVEKIDEGPKNLKNFFKKLGRNFNKLLSVNLMMIFLILPLFVVAYIYIQGPTIDVQTHSIYPVTYSIAGMSDSPVSELLLLLSSTPTPRPLPGSYVGYVVAGIALLYLLTFGWQNVGGNYLLRGIVRGDPVFVVSDYFYAIKKNFKQGFFVGLIDGIILAVLAVDFLFFYEQTDSYLTNIGYFMIVALIFLYTIMRFYIYQQLITFNLKTVKIIKNAFIFTALGIKRNIMALLGIIVVIALNLLLVLIFWPLNIIIPVVLPLFYFLAVSGFIATYAAYPVIEKYMIEGLDMNKGESGGPAGEVGGAGVKTDLTEEPGGMAGENGGDKL